MEEIDLRLQAVLNQTRIGAKVLDAVLDASSLWSQKIVLESEEASEDQSTEDMGEPDAHPKDRKRSLNRIPPPLSAADRSLEMLRDAEVEKAKPKKKRKVFPIFKGKART